MESGYFCGQYKSGELLIQFPLNTNQNMANKEKIDYLLLDIRQLETLIAGMRDAEIYPVSFFSQAFDLTHKILNDLHSLEAMQIDVLRTQMEAHEALIGSLPEPSASVVAEPEVVAPEVEEPAAEPESKDVSTKAMVSDKQGVSLSDMLEKKNLSDFRKAFSLNDRFRFRRELFGGDEEKMNKAIADLNGIRSYEDSVAYLNDELKWNVEDEAVADFLKLLEKRFL